VQIVMKRLLGSVLLLVVCQVTIPKLHGQTAPSLKGQCELSDDTRYDQAYWARSHNTYSRDFWPRITDALDAGFRVIEVDVHTGGGKFGVKHFWGSDTNNNCKDGTGGRLPDCLDDILKWSNRHPNHLPLSVQLDFKQRLSKTEAEMLDEIIERTLGDKVVTPAMVLDSAWTRNPLDIDHPRTLRSMVDLSGFPTVGDLRGKILLFMMGGGPWFRWDVNKTHEKYARWRGERMKIFVCPNVSEPQQMEVGSLTKDFKDTEANGWVVCGNKKATGGWRSIARVAAADNQFVNIWVGTGDHTFDDPERYSEAIAVGTTFINKEQFRDWDLAMNGRRRCTQ
jgi:hypothetical protein